jgi:hypothetical protein
MAMQHAADPRRLKTAFLAGAACLLAAIAYSNALGNPFTFDDLLEVIDNESIEQLSDVPAILSGNLARPVVNMTYALDFALWGGRSDFGFHVTNLFLHLLNVLLVFGLARQLFRDVEDAAAKPRSAAGGAFAAFAAASLFAVHPLLSEAVGYVSSRSELLGARLFLAACLSFRGGWVG